MSKAWWEVGFDAIRDYFERYSSVAVVCLDGKDTIQDCNAGFLRLLGLSEKPTGQPIVDFLADGETDLDKLSRSQEGQSFILRLRSADQKQRTLNCSLARAENGNLLFGEKGSLSESQIVSEISNLNGQLTNMIREVEKKKQALEKANAEIEKLMRTDPLTGVANRRLLMETLEKEMSIAKRHHTPFSILMADLDHFKHINDTYGHDKGDGVLKGFAQLLEENSRTEDLVARFGGEEFMVLLSRTSAAEAKDFAERIREALNTLDFPEIETTVTASFGISQFQETDTSESVIKRADQALYRSKTNGRDRVSVFS